MIDDKIWWCNHLRRTATEKYDKNGKGWYFGFDDDNKMGYEYILSIYWARMSQLNTCNPVYYQNVIERTNSICYADISSAIFNDVIWTNNVTRIDRH